MGLAFNLKPCTKRFLPAAAISRILGSQVHQRPDALVVTDAALLAHRLLRLAIGGHQVKGQLVLLEAADALEHGLELLEGEVLHRTERS